MTQPAKPMPNVDLNAEVPEELMAQFKEACARRRLKLKGGVAAALTDWIANDPKAPVVASASGAVPIEVTAETFEMLRALQWLLETPDEKYLNLSNFIKSELSIISAHLRP